MPNQNRYTFLLGARGDVSKNVSDIYSQLQAPSQRAANASAMNAALAGAASTTSVTRSPIAEYADPLAPNRIRELTNARDAARGQSADIYNAAEAALNAYTRANPPIYREIITVTPGSGEAYESAREKAANAAAQSTLNPNDLVDYYSRSNTSGRRQSRPDVFYINPASEGVYETNPDFDWSGRSRSASSISNVNGAIERQINDLTSGELRDRLDYYEAVEGAKSAADVSAARLRRESERLRTLNGLLRRSAPGPAPREPSRLSYNSNRTPTPTPQQYEAEVMRNAQEQIRSYAAFNANNLALANAALRTQGDLAIRQSSYFSPLSSSSSGYSSYYSR